MATDPRTERTLLFFIAILSLAGIFCSVMMIIIVLK